MNVEMSIATPTAKIGDLIKVRWEGATFAKPEDGSWIGIVPSGVATDYESNAECEIGSHWVEKEKGYKSIPLAAYGALDVRMFTSDDPKTGKFVHAISFAVKEDGIIRGLPGVVRADEPEAEDKPKAKAKKEVAAPLPGRGDRGHRGTDKVSREDAEAFIAQNTVVVDKRKPSDASVVKEVNAANKRVHDAQEALIKSKAGLTDDTALGLAKKIKAKAALEITAVDNGKDKTVITTKRNGKVTNIKAVKAAKK